MTNHSHINAKIGYFWRKKKTFGAENTPPRCRLNIKHVILYAGHLYQPFWTIKFRTGHINGQCNVMYFDLPWPLLPTVSNFYGLKRFYSFGTKTEDIFLFECPSLLCFFLQKLYCCQIILYSVKTLNYNKARSISEKYIIWLVLMPWMCAFSCDSPIHEPACMSVRISCKQKGFFPVFESMW